MGFKIKCEDCGREVQLAQNDSALKEINLHSNRLVCSCGNTETTNMMVEYYERLNKFEPKIGQYLSIIQEHSLKSTEYVYETVWANGCFIKALSIIDSASTISELMPFSTSGLSGGFNTLFAFSKITYSYQNLLSSLHDLLDNIGYNYGIKVYKRTEEQNGKSFFDLFNYDLGKLKTPSYNEKLNETLEELFRKSEKLAKRDNHYKHAYYPGVIHLYVSKSYVESETFSGIIGNIPTYLKKGAVSSTEAIEDVNLIKNEILSLALFCVVQLIQY